MNLKPWRNVVTPREDLRAGRPLDAAEFAVHLDQVRDGQAPPVYQDPRQFFERTFLTRNLADLAAEALRRLSGIQTETSAVFNMTTQFGGGKTHALTLLYHLATHGPQAAAWPGVPHLLERAGVAAVPEASVAVFVGTEFDSLAGRGGEDGTPKRWTPWGEIAYQLGGAEALAVLAEHERQRVAPAGDVIRRFLPAGPCLILLDELINYVSRSRKGGLAAQSYTFLHNLSEVVRGRDNAVLAVSIPASELEMSAEDQADHERFKKLLDRLGKAVVMSAEAETAEIIRRRLFEWDERAVNQDGRVLLPGDAQRTCRAYADWVVEHRQQLPHWFPADHAYDAFAATYPFHPTVLSVFERKWRVLPRFQQTRGILRLLALWVSRAYQESYKAAHRDALIGLGTAPLDDPLFRAAVFEQLGESRLEAAVTTDICGKPDAFALRLDAQAEDALRRARVHRNAATAVFFESNGGQARADATVPEIRLDVGEPELDIGNVETALETLAGECYYLTAQNNRYRFSVSPNLNKLLADRRAAIAPSRVEERVRLEVQKVFASTAGVERIFFPERSNDVPDRPALTLAVVAPDQLGPGDIAERVDAMTREAGTSARTFKSAVIWCVPDAGGVAEEARRLLAWEEIDREQEHLRIDDLQARQLRDSLGKAQRDLREAVWRAYRHLFLLGRDNAMRHLDLGLVHSSAAATLPALILTHLRQQGELEDSIGPNRLLRSWPPAFTEWSTLAVRNAFFASPQFPRVLSGNVLKDTIAKGVTSGLLAYVGKGPGGAYEPFRFNAELGAHEVDLSEDVYVLKAETAQAYLAAQRAPSPPSTTALSDGTPPKHYGTKDPLPDQQSADEPDESKTTVPGYTAVHDAATHIAWEGEVPYRKWMQFYQKVISGFAQHAGLKITVRVDVDASTGVSAQRLQDVRVALRELGLGEDIRTES